MVLKFKNRRNLTYKILGYSMIILQAIALYLLAVDKINFIVFLSVFIQFIFWLGNNYFQALRYDDEKVIAQFWWPKIYYKDIISVYTKFGDIIIKSQKREINISKDSVDSESLQIFLKLLQEKGIGNRIKI